jgi:hypothetical protein
MRRQGAQPTPALFQQRYEKRHRILFQLRPVDFQRGSLAADEFSLRRSVSGLRPALTDTTSAPIPPDSECRVSPRDTRRVRPMPPGTRGMATTLFVPRPPCGRSGDSTKHQPSPTAPTNGWTGCRMPLQILSAGSGIQHPLRHYDNPYGLYPYRGLPAFA